MSDPAQWAQPDPSTLPGGGETTDASKRERERSTIVFPYGDMDGAVTLARTVQDRYGTGCGLDQLAAALGYKSVQNGTFRMRIATARTFGFIEVARQTASLTALGRDVADPTTEPRARVEAFLQVPLYKAIYEQHQGSKLPSTAGLESEMVQLGVSAKQADKARQAFQRSAEQAGFFAHGRDRLVVPPMATTVEDRAPSNGGPETNGTSTGAYGSAKTASVMEHPLIQGLLAVLPEPGEEFPEEDRVMWLKTLDMNLSFIYARPKRKQPEPSTGTTDPSVAGS